MDDRHAERERVTDGTLWHVSGLEPCVAAASGEVRVLRDG